MNFKKKHLSALIAVTTAAVSASSGLVFAQENDQANNVVLEEIVVKGVRYSLRTGLDVKRSSANVVDSIVAEDIGKFPDENVAQSLQRIAGAAIDRPRGSNFGSANGSAGGRLGGQFVQLRGLPVDFTQVSLNGRSLASGRNVGRQFSLDVLPSEFIGRLDVYKTVSADQLEGGIGGNVDILTRLPLDSKEEGLHGAWSAELVNSELPDSSDPRLSGVISTTFADGTMGFLLGGTYSERQTREDEYFSWGNVNFGPGTGDGVDERADLATIPNGTPNAGITYPLATYPIEPLTQLFQDERERTGVNAVYQWQPNDEFELVVDALYSTFDVDEFRNSLPVRYQFRGPQDPGQPVVGGDVSGLNGRGVPGIFPFTVLPGAVLSNDNLVTAEASQVQLRSVGENNVVESDTLAFGANLKWQISEATDVAFDFGYSKGEQDRSQESVILQTFADVSYDARNPSNGVPDLFVTGTDLTDSANYRVSHGNRNFASTEDESISLAVDLDYELDNSSFISEVEVGLRYTERAKDQTRSDGNIGTGTTAGVPAFLPAADIGLLDFPVDDFLSDAGGANVIRQYVVGDPASFHAEFGVPLALTGVSSFEVEEEILAAYIKANLEFSIGSVPVTGNIGVRTVQTDVSALGQLPASIIIRSAGDFDVIGERSSTDSNYNNVLPSINLTADLSEEVLLRFGAGRTVTRPTLSQLSPGFTFNTTTLTANAGNPDLDPFESDSYDLSLEWYFSDGGLLSIAAFRKEIGGFIFSSSAPETIAGVDFLSVTRPQNAAEAEISGFELNFQTDLEFLPAPFDGLGVLANYTHASSSTGFGGDNPQFAGTDFSYTGLSEDVYNLVGYYEKGPVSVRLSYNFRSDYLLEPSFGFFAGPRSVNDYEQLDLSASYKINDRFTATFAATNLTDERFDRFFNEDESIIASTNFTGRQFFFGIRGSF